MIPHRFKLLWLVTAHVVIFSAFWESPRNGGHACLTRLLYADAGVLALWAGLSGVRLGWRISAVVSAAVMATVCDYAIGYYYAGVNYWLLLESAWMYHSYGVIPFVVFGVLSVLRYGKRKVRVVRLKGVPPSWKNNQFLIRHLMVATALVAGILGIGRALQSVTESNPNIWTEVTYLLGVTVQPLIFLWATLGNGRPALRLCIVMPMAYFVGYSPVICHDGYFPPFMMQMAVIDGLQATVTVASLLVVRWCGWRVVSGGSVEADRQVRLDDQGSANAETLGTP